MTEHGDKLLEVFGKISESTESMILLAARLDERIKALVSSQESTTTKIDKIIDNQSILAIRINTLEAKNGQQLHKEVERIDTKLNILGTAFEKLSTVARTSEARWKFILDVAVKITVTVAAAFIIWHFGLK